MSIKGGWVGMVRGLKVSYICMPGLKGKCFFVFMISKYTYVAILYVAWDESIFLSFFCLF